MTTPDRQLLREALKALYNPFEPDNQSKLYQHISAFLVQPAPKQGTVSMTEAFFSQEPLLERGRWHFKRKAQPAEFEKLCQTFRVNMEMLEYSLIDAREHLWRLYEGIYGHRKAEGIDPFKTAVNGALELTKAWRERGQPAEAQLRALASPAEIHREIGHPTVSDLT